MNGEILSFLRFFCFRLGRGPEEDSEHTAVTLKLRSDNFLSHVVEVLVWICTKNL